MPFRSKQRAITDFRSTDLDEPLYASATTRVFRLEAASAPELIVYKVYVGPNAAKRLRHERDLLTRLAGIEGVVQLASAAPRPDVLALRDCGGVALARLFPMERHDPA